MDIDLKKNYTCCDAIIAGEKLLLHPLKAIWWERVKTLLIADLHLGKQGHFRKEGIPVPETVAEKNWAHLRYLLDEFQPETVIFLGDLFHSHMTQEWGDMELLVKIYPHIRFELVIGNHDKMPEFIYRQAGIGIHAQHLILPPFIISHEPLETADEQYYNLAGHIHPAVRLAGKGYQFHRAACFWFKERCGVLPAFGQFTGLYSVHPKATDKIYVVVQQIVLHM
ncbi:MAG: ligase-associated DNA damage response endonuclease PdeM [Chitinophagales bacterium]|nr:ligase-associated DNA damage response endonuclease PdeM [Chitinophagales bacterium]